MNTERKYFIDWIRVIAIALLLLYHSAIGFQPWGMMIAFITNAESWQSLWIPMAMLSVWRIPLLFFVSGMGLYFAFQNRTLKQVMVERAGRILVPYVFGIFCIVPIHLYLWQSYYKMRPGYNASPGHLWFLGNIFTYVLILSPLFYYLKKNETGKMVKGIKIIFSSPLAWPVVVAAFIAEALIVKPLPYEMYAMTWHGFFLGLLAFFFGFCFVLTGEGFWKMIVQWRWVYLTLALGLFAVRFFVFNLSAPVYLLVAESQSWIFAVLAFGCKYLNRPGETLGYLSQAAYPVYILHMIFLYLGSLLIFPLEIDVYLKFILVLSSTFIGSMGTYELLIRRVKLLRVLFGLRKEMEPKKVMIADPIQVSQS
jgi:hypothetical protein